MRNRWPIALAWFALPLPLACTDSHGPHASEDMPATAGSARTPAPAQPTVPPGDRSAPRDPPSMIGSGVTPAAEAQPDPDVVDRPRDPQVPPPASEHDPAQPQRDPDLPAPDALGEPLLGHWFADGPVGDCFSLRDWYSFEPDGAVINRGIDDNACSGVRVLSEATGYVVPTPRIMGFVLDGPGSERPFDMTAPIVDVAKRVERFSFAIGERPATISSPSATFLDAKAFHSNEGEHFESLRTVSFRSASDELLFEQEVKILLHLEPGLPAAVGTVLDVVVHVELAQLDTATGMPAMNDTIELEYLVVVRDGPVWRQLEPTAFAGLSAVDANDAWQVLLDDAGVAAHPTWAQRLLQAHFFPSQRYKPDDSLLLSSTLPEYGRWTRSDSAPPVPANTP